ncbi:GLUG motif-containing protein, partial [Bosea lathyri]
MTRFVTPVGRHSRHRLLRSLLASTALASASLFLVGLPRMVAVAQSLPTSGTVAAGAVTINQAAPNRLVVNQSSAAAVTNWQSFSIGTGSSVAVVQPSTSAAMLARVTGTTTSTIAGSLTATGQLVLVNPNGISITPTGTVNAGSGFVATTLGISDSDFLNGKRGFTGNGASGAVSNAGTITVGPGGYAALIGGTVDNAGTISVPMGKVGLGSGELATLDFSGDGFLQVGVPTNAPGTGALVSNSGKIRANGGTVEIKAAAARDAARQAINMSGVVAARSVSGRDGNITLDGGHGAVVVAGKLNVASRDGKGGRVTVTGRDIKLAGATLDASGKTGGGTVRIGGDRQGKGTLARAETVSIDAASTIKADATSTGNGGDVVVWSDVRTAFAGLISAKGGALSGDGGEVEVSGKALLDYTGYTDLSAANGRFGTLLLDPYNVTISGDADSNASGFTATGNDSVISVATLQAALAGANVSISTGSGGAQAGNITVANAISWTAGTALTLTAANDITINAPITFGGATGAGLFLNATHALAINAPIQVRGAGAVALNYNPASTSNLSFGLTGSGFTGSLTYRSSTGAALTSGAGGTLSINGKAYTLLYSMSDVETLPGQNFGEGYFALAHDLDASGRTYNDALIGNTISDTFYGTLEGSGHIISNLTIISRVSGPIGLIGRLGRYGAAGNGTDGVVRNIGLVGGSVVSGGIGFESPEGTGGLVGANNGGTISNAYNTGTVSGEFRVGGLVGVNTEGRIISSYATGAVSAVAGPNAHDSIGGLVGASIADPIHNSGLVMVTNSYATGTVSGGSYVGGLIGSSGFSGGGYGGVVTDVYATGAVHGTGNYVGGLVGFHDGRLTNAYATGAVSGADYVGGVAGRYNGDSPFSTDILYATGAVSGRNFVGGLIGHNTSGLRGSHATGAVTGTGDYVGGLIGTNMAYLEAIYATGAVSSTGNNVGGLAGENQLGRLTGAYATGEVRGADSVGGLVGLNSGRVIDAYATGAVTGANHVGGLVGLGFWAREGISGTVTNAYATGAVSGNTNTGGLVGFATSGTTSNAYWDTQTSGQSTSSGGGAGLTTAQFQSGGAAALGSAFAGGAGGLYPYLASFYPDGVQAISGYAYSNAGTTPLASGLGGAQYVFASAGGANLAPVTTGADGYYYILMPNGTLASGGTRVLAYTTANNAATGTMTGANLVQAAGTAAGVDLYGGYLRSSTTSTLYSTAQSERASTLASLSSAQQGALAALAPFYIATHASGFTLDQTLDLSSGFGVQTTAGGLTVAASITLAGSNALTMASAGDLAINAPISVTGGGQVRLSHSTANTTTGGLTFGAGSALTFADGQSGQTLHVNGHEYMLVRSMAGIEGIDNQTGRYALAHDLDAGPNRMGAVATIFNGTLDGLGHTISNLTINDIPVEDISFFHYDYVGLIGQLTGTVRNIGVIGGSITGRNYTGALIGYNQGLVQNAYATARVTGYNLDLDASYTGGLVGSNAGTVSNSYAAGIVSGTSVIGGLVGENNGLIVASHAAGTVSGLRVIGGLVGFQTGTINNSYASGVVSGIGDVGGLVGSNSGNVDSSHASATVTGSGDNIGGLVGNNSIQSVNLQPRVGNSYATGAVSGRDNVGGLVGYNLKDVRGSYATGTVSGRDNVGGLAGYGQGNVFGNHASGAVIGFNNVGGLLGYGSGADSYATGAVTGISNVGGLAGSGGVGRSYATGAVTGTTNVGGLVGSGSASESHASGAVTGSDNVGGLVGYHTAGESVYQSHATGAVIGINNVGGLVGHSDQAASSASYATGAVSGVNRVGGLVGYLSKGPVGYGSTGLSFATGAVSGVSNVGGLVGESYKGNVGFAYATGAVSGTSNVGGLIGKTSGDLGNSQYGYVTSTYSTGVVSGTTNVGGLVGLNDLATITNGYWDIQTSGQSGSAGGTGLTTRQLQGLEPLSGSTYFSVAANLTNYFSGGMDGVYPFLSHFYPGYVQAISGYATTGTGAAAVAAQVALYQGGNQLGGTISTGANGYYYAIVAPHTLASGGSLGQSITLAGATAPSGLSYSDGLTIGANGHLAGLSIASGWRDITSAAPTWSALITAPMTAFGTDRYAALATSLASSSIRVNATGAGGFTLDSALALGSNDVTLVANGPLTLAETITANTITLASGGAFTNIAGANALNAGNRWLAYSANPADNRLGGLTPGFIQYNAAYGVTPVAETSGNGLLYTLAPVLTASLTGATTKTYDGTTTATLASGNYAMSPTVGGDSVTLTSLAGIAYDTANAGTGKIVTASGLDIASASNGAINVYGYQLASTTASGAVGMITPATLTYDAMTATRLYGDANPALTGAVTGFV